MAKPHHYENQVAIDQVEESAHDKAHRLSVCALSNCSEAASGTVPARAGHEFYENYHGAAASGRPVHFEEYFPEPLNKWLGCHCYPSDEGLAVCFRGISDRKRAEEARQEITESYEWQ